MKRYWLARQVFVADGCAFEGTRITVNQIVTLYKHGYTPEEVADQYSHLSLSQVYTALAYYHANKEEIEADLIAEMEAATQLERESLDLWGAGKCLA